MRASGHEISGPHRPLLQPRTRNSTCNVHTLAGPAPGGARERGGKVAHLLFEGICRLFWNERNGEAAADHVQGRSYVHVTRSFDSHSPPSSATGPNCTMHYGSCACACGMGQMVYVRARACTRGWFLRVRAQFPTNPPPVNILLGDIIGTLLESRHPFLKVRSTSQPFPARVAITLGEDNAHRTKCS